MSSPDKMNSKAKEYGKGSSGKKRERTTFQEPLESPPNSSVSMPKPVSDNLKNHVTKLTSNTPSSSPPNKKLSSMQDLIEADQAVANLILSHEIALNDQFEVKELNKEQPETNTRSAEDKLRDTVKETMHQVFWDCISNDLESDPPIYDHVFVLVKEIKELLLSLLPPDRDTSLHKRIREGLDIQLLNQQAEKQVLDVSKLAAFIVDTMSMMCAPARDEEVEALKNETDLISLLKQIYVVIGAMKKDHANFLISSFRPVIQKEHIEYERMKFTEILTKLSRGMETTEKWIRSCYEELMDELELQKNQAVARRGSPEQVKPPSPLTVLTTCGRFSPWRARGVPDGIDLRKKCFLAYIYVIRLFGKSLHARIYTSSVRKWLKRAYIMLLKWEQEFPETVLVDEARFRALGVEFRRVLVLASTLLITFSSLGTDLASHQVYVRSLKQELLVLLKPSLMEKSKLPTTLEGVAEQVLHRTSNHLQSVNSPVTITDEKKAAFRQQISTLSGFETNTVFSVLVKRAHEHLYATAEYHSRKTAPSSYSVAVPPGLQIVTTELSAVADTYAKLVNLNQVVYGPFYAPLLRKVMDLPSTSSISPMASPRSPRPSDMKTLSNAKRQLDMDKEQVAKCDDVYYELKNDILLVQRGDWSKLRFVQHKFQNLFS